MFIKPKNAKVELTFPQANDIYKIIKFGDGLMGNFFEKRLNNISLDISDRQINYYYSSGVYLGLFKQRDRALTELGELVFSQNFSDVLRLLVYLILSDQVFYDFFINRNMKRTEELLVSLFNLDGTTPGRRAEQVKKWIDWCDIVISEQKIEIFEMTEGSM
ncbi:DUF7226 domain-containing protein [Candidatus Xianfuyuplasma coldseepsis]|uniref:DUF7226 domain-containing protein n=1 Tax=Candidatus Xianfuyuplasma coldseepsis TaxID=2782163 RepID=A0A7L7KSB9_9MOLU|nr:hypothetical protein [Xianfuyuplasma coldseepsis]QMS85106.1 hypothetical protein G4Z02_04895 [Xianfuyuplasma coldseepsis]